MRFDRHLFFDCLRGGPMFGASFTQQQVDGLNLLLTGWEQAPTSEDIRHFAYMLATVFHECAATMTPIEEYGRGAGHPYGVPDPVTGQTYFGRGYVQLTWRDNYARADAKLALAGGDSLEWHAALALEPDIAYMVMARGMEEGWFTGLSLPGYFAGSVNDPEGARKIINPDDLGSLVAGYHDEFLAALQAALIEDVTITIRFTLPKGSRIEVTKA